ncbi:unnamed protein product, partial [Trichogramma brassicae]
MGSKTRATYTHTQTHTHEHCTHTKQEDDRRNGKERQHWQHRQQDSPRQWNVDGKLLSTATKAWPKDEKPVLAYRYRASLRLARAAIIDQIP